MVRHEGSFDQHLVLKPWPMLDIAFGGGEEGQWQRAHPGESLPWFMTGDYIRLISLDWEQGQPLFAELYFYGWFINALLLLGVLLVVLIRRAHLWHRKRKRPVS